MLQKFVSAVNSMFQQEEVGLETNERSDGKIHSSGAWGGQNLGNQKISLQSRSNLGSTTIEKKNPKEGVL